jgi:hypothetical protein
MLDGGDFTVKIGSMRILIACETHQKNSLINEKWGGRNQVESLGLCR